MFLSMLQLLLQYCRDNHLSRMPFQQLLLMNQDQELSELAASLSAIGEITHNAFFVRVRLPEHTLTIFRGGPLLDHIGEAAGENRSA